MSFCEKLSTFLRNVQYTLFPDLEERIGVLSPSHKKLIEVLELIRIEDFIPCSRFNWGRPLKDRAQIARAFVAKIIFKVIHTKSLISLLQNDSKLRAICGWNTNKIPSEAKFSRAFKEFSEMQLPEKVHQALLSEVYKDRIIMHVIKDSTPIPAREAPLKKVGDRKERRNAINRQQIRDKRNGVSRKQKQLKQDLRTSINELPRLCDTGSKMMPDKCIKSWKGYKLHAAIDDQCIPLAVIVTSASLNDSEVAIPLAAKADGIVKNFYDLMDSAYNAPEIKEYSRRLGHVPIIAERPRSRLQKEAKKIEDKKKRSLNVYAAEEIRYRKRVQGERFNALLKDYYGGRNVWYRGHVKVTCHLQFGILALTATTLISLV